MIRLGLWETNNYPTSALSHPSEPSLAGDPDSGGTWGTLLCGASIHIPREATFDPPRRSL
jgi:hypothetical protein